MSVCAGCSAVIALANPSRHRDLSAMSLGASRSTVLKEFGLPSEIYQLVDGSKVDSWRFKQGDSTGRRVSRALLYSVVGVGTLGFSEFGIAPYELLRKLPPRTYVVEYDPEGRVRGTTILGRSGFIQQQGASRAVLGMERISPEPSRLSPDMERRNGLTAIAERHRVSVAKLSFQRLSGHVYLDDPTAENDAAVRAYVVELCSSEYGLVLGRRAGDATGDVVIKLGTSEDGVRHVAFRCPPPAKRPDALAIGTPRRALLGEYGLPDDSAQAEDGSRVDVWDVDLGMLQKLAAVTGWSGRSGTLTYIVHYDVEDRITATMLLADNGWVSQRGNVPPHDDPAALAAAVGASVTTDLVRERELARIAARHGLSVAMLDFDPRNNGGTALLDGPTADGATIVDAYVAEMCTAKDGLLARERASRATTAGVSVRQEPDQAGRWNVRYVCGS
jgi:hypothetical protein